MEFKLDTDEIIETLEEKLRNKRMIWNTGKPEFFFYDVDNISFLVKLTDGGIIKASRSNGHWFGMWRWLQDDEVKEWTALYHE